MTAEQEQEESPKRRERRDARANRQHILAVAKRLFADQGAEATSMYEVAQAANVGQGTLYRHFADKSELCHALIREDIQAFQARVEGFIGDRERYPSALQRLDLFINEKVFLTDSHLSLLVAAGGPSPKRFRGPFNQWMYDRLTPLLEEALANGELAPLDVAFTADALLAAITPHLHHYQRHELGYSCERIIAGMRHIFIEGLRAK